MTVNLGLCVTVDVPRGPDVVDVILGLIVTVDVPAVFPGVNVVFPGVIVVFPDA